MDAQCAPAASVNKTPGPNIYKSAYAIGPQTLSQRTSAPCAHMGSAKRFGGAGSAINRVGGPGMVYDAASSALGKQVYSRKKTTPSFGFGTSTRDGCSRVRFAELCFVFAEAMASAA